MCLIRVSPDRLDDAYVYRDSRYNYRHSTPGVVLNSHSLRHAASHDRRSRLFHPQEDADIAANAAAHAAASAVRDIDGSRLDLAQRSAYFDSRSPSRSRLHKLEDEAFAEGYRAGRSHGHLA